jgi:hypothetical protein
MAVTSTPIFVQAPRVAVGTVSVANTNRDGTGTIATVWTAGSNASRIDHIDINATGTTTAGVIRLYIHDGSTAYLWREILVTAVTPSTSIAVWSASIDCSQPQNLLVLPSGYSLRASTHNAETFRLHAVGGDF